MTDTEPQATAPSLREELVAAIDNYPVACWTPGNLADRVLAVILPHGKLLGDQLRRAEGDVQRVISLYEQWLKTGPPPLGTSVSRWWDARLVELHDAILPPTHDGPSVREAAADDRRWPLEKHGE